MPARSATPRSLIGSRSLNRRRAVPSDPSRVSSSSILQSLPQAVFWKDRDGVYLGCNQAFCRGGRPGVAGPDHRQDRIRPAVAARGRRGLPGRRPRGHDARSSASGTSASPLHCGRRQAPSGSTPPRSRCGTTTARSSASWGSSRRRSPIASGPHAGPARPTARVFWKSKDSFLAASSPATPAWRHRTDLGKTIDLSAARRPCTGTTTAKSSRRASEDRLRGAPDDARRSANLAAHQQDPAARDDGETIGVLGPTRTSPSAS